MLGSHQEKIIQSLKMLVDNGKKVNAQEIEIKELYDELDNMKQENFNLKNKLEYKRDIICRRH